MQTTTRRLIRVVVVLGLIVNMLAAPALAGDSPFGDAAAPWPTDFAPYTTTGGDPVSDPQDVNPAYSDLYAGASGELPTVYVTSDGDNVFFRVRVRDDPTSKNGGFNSTSWLVSLAVDGVQAAVVGVNGKPSATDYVYTSNADGSVTRQIYTTPFTNDGDGTSFGARAITAPDEGWFVDYQVPIAQITAVAPTVTGSTPVQLFYGTSQAANLSVINKDFMRGDGVTYDGLSTIRADGEAAASNPAAADDVATVDGGGNVVVDVLANDSDPDGDLDPTSVNVITGPANGSTTVDPVTGEITYTPTVNYLGPDSFTYQICDTAGACDTATVAVTVTSGADPPTANNDSAAVGEDGEVVIYVAANDSDPDGDLDPTSVNVSTGPANGSTTVDPVTGDVTYTPDDDYNGPDSLTYQICDQTSPTPLCDTATVSLSVTAINDAPSAVDDPSATPEDSAIVVDVAANDSDVDANLDATSVTIITEPTNGSTTVDPVTGEITYTPDDDYNGPDTLTYQICDTAGACDTATVAVTVTSGADPPTANNDSAAVGEDGEVVIYVAANDSDPDGDLDPTSVNVSTGPANGSTTVDPVTGDVTYTPDDDYNGPDSLTYQICDQTSPTPLCDTATVSLSVTAINDAPSAVDDPSATPEDSAIVVDVAANDSDVDANLDATSVTIITEPTNGSTTVDPVTGEITYTPDDDYNGPDTLTYQICDTAGACDTATVAVTVTSGADPPTANNDSAATVLNTDVVVPVLANDSDVDGDIDPATVNVTSGPTNGSTAVDPTTGEITYTPAFNYLGSDSFTYQVCDQTSPTPVCDTATVSIDLDPGLNPPVAGDDVASTDEDVAITIDVVLNDSDVDGNLDATSVTILTEPTNGTTTVDPVTGEITYTPDDDYNGPDTLTYQICDTSPTPLCDVATVTLTIDADNDPPVANSDAISTPEDTPVVIDVADNDTDVDGNLDTSTVTIVSPPTHGTTTVDPVTGEVTYTPDDDYNGPDTFTYRICDTSSDCSVGIATVSTTVVEIDDPPVAGDDVASTDEDVAITIDVVLNDSDVDGNLDATLVTILTEPTNGTTTVDPVTGEITYTPDDDYNGPDTLTYQICDTSPTPLCDVATVTLTIDADNDPPVANSDAISTPEDTPVVIDVADNDTDVDGNLDTSTVTIVSPPTHGTTTVDPVTGEVTYTPDDDYNGPDTFTYRICDTSSDCSVGIATVSTTVVEIDDPPVAGDDVASTDEDVAITIDVVLNDSDVDGNLDATSVTILTEPTNGTTTVDPVTGEITYTPDDDYNGPDTLTYQICDTSPTPLCDVATVTLTIDADNDPPLHVGATTVTLAIGGRPDPLQIVDPEGHNYTVIAITGVHPPGLRLSDNGTLTGEATTEGTFSVSYRACDHQTPAACSEFTVVYQVGRLALTGTNTKQMVLIGFTLTLLGAGLLLVDGRRRAANRLLEPTR